MLMVVMCTRVHMVFFGNTNFTKVHIYVGTLLNTINFLLLRKFLLCSFIMGMQEMTQ